MRSALLAGVAASGFNPALALAADATWIGTGSEWIGAGNWSAGVVPDGTATFTGQPQFSILADGTNSIGSIIIGDGAPAYTITIGGVASFIINDTGVFNAPGSGTLTFQNNGELGFIGASTAGSSAIGNNGYLVFEGAGSAGTSSIDNGDTVEFYDSSSAADATIINDGGVVFFDAASAGSSNITNNLVVQFEDDSSADGATIVNNGGLAFFADSTAGNATITTTNGAMTLFGDDSDGGNAAFIVEAGGLLDFSASAGTSGTVTAGSIAGAGEILVGGSHDFLMVGGNNLSTEFSGTISECGCFAGALIKTGSGTLTLSGASTYTGGTIIAGGTLRVEHDDALGTGAITTTGSVLDYAAGIDLANPIIINSNTTQLQVLAGTATQSGDISEMNGPRPLEKIGAGMLVLTGDNSYTGQTKITAGTLVAATDTALDEETDVVINSGASLAVADGVLTDINSLSGSGGVLIGMADPSTTLGIGFAGGATTTFSGSILGAGSLDFLGGVLTLTGDSDIGGLLSICECGTLNIDGGSFAAAGGTIAGGTFNVTNGGTLETVNMAVTGTMRIVGPGSTVTAGQNGVTIVAAAFAPALLSIEGGGVLNSEGGAGILAAPGESAAVIVTGTQSRWNVDNGLAVGAAGAPATLTVADGGVVNSTGFTTIEVGSTLNLGAGGLAGAIMTPTIVNDGGIKANFTDISTLSADIEGDGSLTKSGTGTLVLSGDNSYTGGTTLAGGTLRVESDTALGTGAVTTTGSTLDYADGVAIANDIVLNSNATKLQVLAGTATQSGDISETGGSRPLEKIGAGTLILSGQSLYTGATTVSGGTLRAGAADAFAGASSYIVSSGATLDLGNFDQTIGSLAGDGAVTLGNGTLTTGGNDSSTAFSGTIDGSGGLAKTGAGTLVLSGANSYTGATEIIAGALQIGNATSAGKITGDVLNNAGLIFENADTSGIDTIGNLGQIEFHNSTGGGMASITNSGEIKFLQDATADNAALQNSGDIVFDDSATAGAATITNRSLFGRTVFTGGSTAGNSTINNNSNPLSLGGLFFYEASTAGSATIITGGTGETVFNDNSTGGGARFVTAASGLVDFSETTGARNDGQITAGSIEGAGTYFIGHGNTLSVGSNNLSTEVNGIIADDCACGPDAGGTLEKTGTGTLTLSGANTYSGGTLIAGGMLRVEHDNALGTGAVTTTGSTLDYAGGVAIANEIVLNSNTTKLQVLAGTATQSGDISELKGPRPLEKTGTGTLILSGQSLYTGATTVSEGTLRAGADHTFAASSAFNISRGATLDLAGFDQEIGSLAGGGTVLLRDGDLIAGLDNTSTTFSGTIRGSRAFAKAGTGTFVLAGTIDVAGMEVLGGTMQIGVSAQTGKIAGHIINSGRLNFENADTNEMLSLTNFSYARLLNATSLGTASITNLGTMEVLDNAAAGNASVYSYGRLLFGDSSTAGNATINTDAGGETHFTENATGGNARFITAAGGYVDFSETSGPDGDGRISAGSIEGAGDYYIGRENILTVGGNNRSTEVSGVIAEHRLDDIGFGGMLVKTGTGTLTLSGANTYSGGTDLAGGTLRLANDDAPGSGEISVTNSDAVLDYADGVSISNGISMNADTTLQVLAGTGTQSGDLLQLNGEHSLKKIGGGTLILSGYNLYSGSTTVSEGTLLANSQSALTELSDYVVGANGTLALADSIPEAGIGSLSGLGDVVIGTASLLSVGANDRDSTFAGVISGAGSLKKSGSGNLILTGGSTYTGATTVNSGGFFVNGSIASSSIAVNDGATLGGTGTVGATIVDNGGTIAPGNSIGILTVSGDLTFASGSIYALEVSTAGTDLIDVTAGDGDAGAADLAGGTVQAVYAPGSYIAKRYTILHAAGGLGGTEFAGLTGTAPAGFTTSLSYDLDSAYLDLGMVMADYSGLNQNQQHVADALTGFFDRTGGIPAEFAALTPQGLTLASGEAGTGSIGTGIYAADRFLDVITDPFVAGRGVQNGGNVEDHQASAYAPEIASAAADGAYAALLARKEAHAVQHVLDRRWKMWGAAYGGALSIDGDAIIGSQDATQRVHGLAAGFDHGVGDSVWGFALGAANASFGLANGLGSGDSGIFNVGIYGTRQFGAAYLTGALAYGWNSVSTSRVLGGEELSADFNAQTLSGRVEAGYRFDTAAIGVTPYAAFQATSFFLPGYSETASGPGTFALAYDGRTTAASRIELGARFDKGFVMSDEALLTLRGRAAWAYDGDTDRSATATFQQLPGATFIVDGAARAENSALVNAGADVAWTNGFSAGVSFQGEFSSNAHSLSGSAKLSYRW